MVSAIATCHHQGGVLMCLHVAMAHNVSGEEIVSLVGLVVNKMYVVVA